MSLLNNAYVRAAHDDKGFYVAVATMPGLHAIRHADGEKFAGAVERFISSKANGQKVAFGWDEGTPDLPRENAIRHGMPALKK